MPTISEQLTELINQKNTLANNINAKGVEASTSETLNTLVPKVLEISSENKFPSLVDKSITTVTADDLEDITIIGDYTFYRCSSLTSITIPENITDIGYSAFYGSTALIELNFNATNMNDLYSGKNSFYNAGQNSSGITLNIGASVTKIPAYLVASQTANSYPKIVTVNFVENSQCTSIGNSAFYNCNSLAEVTIGSGVISMGTYVFYGCKNVTKINFNATNMNDLASNNYIFHSTGVDGNGITVMIGANVIKIPAYLFCPFSNSNSYCPNIVTVNFVENSQCTSIGERAFYRCINLVNIELPENISNIGDYAFSFCTNLTSLTIYATIPPILGTSAIPGNVTTIYIPAGTLNAYQSAPSWSSFANKFVEMQ